MTRSLLDTDWLKKLDRYRRLYIGYSGGLDSTVLLHNLISHCSLTNKLTAVHINHGLSPNALTWQKHCEKFCSGYKIPLVIEQVEFTRQANIEEEARKARYKAFARLLNESDALVLGHHLNDQAETLLLQLFRGAGIDGLAAMAPIKQFAQGELLRPFLHYSRQSLEDYAQFHQLKCVDDESNLDVSYTRNFLRHQVLPVLQQRWPAIETNLGRTTQHCQQAKANLDDLARIDCPSLNESSMTLPVASLHALSQARLSNVLRVWFKCNQVKLPSTLIFNRVIKEVIQAKEDANPLVAWKDACVRRYQQTLYLIKHEPKIVFQARMWPSFPKPLTIEGLGKIYAEQRDKGLVLPEQAKVEVRFRTGGELFNWHGQTKQLKKLFQEWHIPPWQRDSIPLLYVNSLLAAVIGYAIADCFYDEGVLNAYQLFVNPTRYKN